MKINGSPLLYGRTYRVDFGSQFLVQPDFFSKSDAEWAFTIVSSSMDHSDFVGRNGRCVIFGNGRFVVVGLVIEFEELFKKCGLEPVYNRLDHERGRAAYGFIGLVLKRTGREKAFHVPVNILAALYREMIAPIWDRRDLGEPVKMPAHEISVEESDQMPDSNLFQAISFSQQRLQPAVFENDQELTAKISHCVLMQALKGSKIVFCSNADEIRADYRKAFDVVTCADPKNFVSVFEDNDDNLGYDSTEPIVNEVQGYDQILMTNQKQNNRVQNRVLGKEGKSGGGRLNKERKNSGRTNKGDKNSEGQLKKDAALSYDDILEQNRYEDNKKRESQSDKIKKKSVYAPEGALDEEINRYNRTQNRVKKNKIVPADGIIILGVIAGITYCIVGAVNSVNPVVLAVAGAVTFVLVGIEAKRIIDLFI